MIELEGPDPALGQGVRRFSLGSRAIVKIRGVQGSKTRAKNPSPRGRRRRKASEA
jgi:hypothetical protein